MRVSASQAKKVEQVKRWRRTSPTRGNEGGGDVSSWRAKSSLAYKKGDTDLCESVNDDDRVLAEPTRTDVVEIIQGRIGE